MFCRRPTLFQSFFVSQADLLYVQVLRRPRFGTLVTSALQDQTLDRTEQLQCFCACSSDCARCEVGVFEHRFEDFKLYGV